ncbi:hypothetical protein GNI_136910 [Gregarina niphandrodes]|uniref:Uncharacterized protein n=1 Tax=Gregarina niphandrodes TaxID=110365 RepID=A0A023B0Q5_GRENI|nr:hypothetical protein GNI_136910 [Gregarina niphandrodes]EZG45744.1 hypothetical protein GNI_136910 [Gregarina niphandrodes]|eukprot:XP_011132450.1 hypothetical protein GNI_136910 [Gregarina niphandrodes]
MRNITAGQRGVEGVMMAGSSLLRALLGYGGSMECQNEQVSVTGRAFILTGATDWQSSERDLGDSVILQQRLYGPFWSWAHDILLNDWDHMIPYVVKQEWERQGGCRTVATLARIAAKIGQVQIPTMSYYDCSSENDTETIAFTEEVFESVASRHCLQADGLRFGLFAREFQGALSFAMRDFLLDHVKDGTVGSMEAQGQEVKVESWQEIKRRLLHRLCDEGRRTGANQKNKTPIKIPTGIKEWARNIRKVRNIIGKREFEKRLASIKYGDIISALPVTNLESCIHTVWLNRLSHLPCYSVRLYGPLDSDERPDRSGYRAVESCRRATRAYFEEKGNQLKPLTNEVDEIVAEIIRKELLPDWARLGLTERVIDYILRDWTPPSSTVSPDEIVACREMVPSFSGTVSVAGSEMSTPQASNVLFQSPDGMIVRVSTEVSTEMSTEVPTEDIFAVEAAKIRRRESRHRFSAQTRMDKLIFLAKSQALESGIMPEEISGLGMPFVISREFPRLVPLGALMWAYDVLKYDLLHVLPTPYQYSLTRIPSVVELAMYATTRLRKQRQLGCYPSELYYDFQEVTDFRTWSNIAIEHRLLRSQTMERRKLCLPDSNDLCGLARSAWADRLLGMCWGNASQVGEPDEMVPKHVFLAIVYSHICEAIRYDPASS